MSYLASEEYFLKGIGPVKNANSVISEKPMEGSRRLMHSIWAHFTWSTENITVSLKYFTLFIILLYRK